MPKPIVRSPLVDILTGRKPDASPVVPSRDAASGVVPSVEGPARIACTVQDGHTRWEQDLYEAMWRLGERGDDVRIVTVGYTLLGRAARLSDKAVKRNLESLAQKLAIDVLAGEDQQKRLGHTYRVYGFRRILERRREAGLTRVVLSGHAVHLSGDVSSGDESGPSGDVPTGVSGDVPSMPSGDGAPGVLGIKKEDKKEACPLCSGTGWTKERKPRRCACLWEK